MGILDNNYDIIIITETWLTPNFNTTEYFPLDYLVHRKDRHDSVTDSRGGGVLIAVDASVPSVLIAQHAQLDVIAVRTKLSPSFSAILVALYIPYGSNVDYYAEITNYIDTLLTTHLRCGEQLLIIGDFNLPDATWLDIDGLLTCTSADVRATSTVDFFTSIPTSQVNRVRNQQNKLLDLVFATDEARIVIMACDDFTGHSSIYHTPISLTIHHDARSCNRSDSFTNDSYFNFRCGDYASLNESLCNRDWSFLQKDADLHSSALRLNDYIWTGIHSHVPLVKRIRSFREPWYNHRLAALERRRNKLHSLYRTRGDRFYSSFSMARREFKILNSFLYNNYILQIEDQLTTSPKNFWRFINAKRKTDGFPSQMFFNGQPSSSPLDICNSFASYFMSVYEPLSPFNLVPTVPPSESGLFHLTEDEVHAALLHLDTTKGAGHDLIPSIVLKNCADSLTPPLTFIFNESLRTGLFPDPWKISFIRPLFKSGVRSDVSNYRGIAILSSIPKVFEALVCQLLFSLAKPTLTPLQHGFFPGRSTVTNLASFCGHIFQCVGSHRQLDVIYTDFSKAFDKIDHSILFDKLIKLDLRSVPNAWLISYLSNRWQYVKICDTTSFSFRVTSGVPQGSHIGPLLFLLFVNDVVDCFKFAKCLLYADDIKIFAPVADLSDCIHLQSDLDAFYAWSTANKLFLNTAKCKSMSFFRHRSPISYQYSFSIDTLERVEFITDLGVTFSSDVTFNRHIDCITSRAYMMLGFIKRNCRNFCDPLTLKSVYVALVRSILEYSSPIWNPHYNCHSSRIESIQKQFLLFALRRHQTRDSGFVISHYSDRCSLLGLQSLERRRDVASVLFIRDVLLGRVDCAEILSKLRIYAPERTLRRRNDLLFIPRGSSNILRSEPVLDASRLFNKFSDCFDFYQGILSNVRCIVTMTYDLCMTYDLRLIDYFLI